MSEQKETKLVKVGALWTSKDGAKTVATGQLDGFFADKRVVLFKREPREGQSDKAPDLDICVEVPVRQKNDDVPF